MDPKINKNGKRKGLKKIICRYCGPTRKPINQQSYPSHLSTAHGDNSGDRRVYGESKISFTPVRRAPAGDSGAQKSEDEGDVADCDDEEEADCDVNEGAGAKADDDPDQGAGGDGGTADLGQEVFNLSALTPRPNRRRSRSTRAFPQSLSRSHSRNSVILTPPSPSPSRHSVSLTPPSPSLSSCRRSRSIKQSRKQRLRSESSDSDSNSSRSSRESQKERRSSGSRLQDRFDRLEKELEDLKWWECFVKEKLHKLDKIVDIIVENIGAEIELENCEGDFDELEQKLEAVKKFSSVQKCVRTLDGLVKELKPGNASKAEQAEEQKKTREEEVGEILNSCRSILDIETKLPEFEYSSEDGGKFECNVCDRKVAKYSTDLEDDFSESRRMGNRFCMVKRAMKDHVETDVHQKALKKDEVIERQEAKEDIRNRKIGLILGRICYYLLRYGRPHSDFVLLVNVLAKSGVDVGELNHSHEFVSKWSVACAEVVDGRLKGYFGTRLPQTGQRPSVKVMADGATWKHMSRQISGLVSVVPDTNELIQCFLISTNPCRKHSGQALADDLFISIDKYIVGYQYLGMAVDGQYIHCKVGPKLAELFGTRGHDDYDPLHRSGRQDAKMRADNAPKQFKFMGKVTDKISRVYKFVNWGTEFHHFLDVVAELKESGFMKDGRLPRFFSETRFPNFVAKIYQGFRDNYPALIKVLAEVQEELGAGSSTDKKKADQAAGCQEDIYNLKFCLTLSSLADIYSVFSKMVNILQTVNILPMVKYDLFIATIEELQDMMKTLLPEDCPCWMLREGYQVQKTQSKRKRQDSEEAERSVEDGASEFRREDACSISDSDSDLDIVVDRVISYRHNMEVVVAQDEVTWELDELVGEQDRVMEEQDRVVGEQNDVGCVTRVVVDGIEGAEVVGDDEINQELVKLNAETIPLVCSWQSLHADLQEYKLKSEYRGVVMGQLVADPLRLGTRSAESQVKANWLLGEEDIIKQVQKQCQDVVEHLHKNLKENVYDENDLKMLKHIRVVLDLEYKLKMVMEQGPIGASQQSIAKFYESAQYIDHTLDTKCNRDEFRLQYQLHLRKLQEIGSMKDSSKLSSMQIMILLMNTEAERYLGTEAVMDILTKACVMKTNESIVESWISVLEHHSSKVRNLKQDSIQTEMMIAINGPDLQHADNLILEAMQGYWRRAKSEKSWNGHFIRRSRDIKTWFVSKAVDSLNSKPVLTPFMF